MSLHAHHTETETRRSTMLRTAFCPVVREALEAPDTIEVMANPDGSVWIEKAGVGVIISQHTLAPCDRERVIRLVASGVGEAAGRASPIVSAELPGTGERFEGLLPPVSTAPCFSIRKPATTPFELGDYVDQGALAPALATALKDAIASHANILIAGGTSSGKTTFTNALLAEASLHGDRIVILEDTRELKCAAPNVVQLRTHRGSTSLQDLVRSTLRLRPDRIIVGEVRGAEALDLLKAWGTGHPGGIGTIHAGSGIGALRRLEQLIQEAVITVPRALIAETIDLVAVLAGRGSARRLVELARVDGLGPDGDYRITPATSSEGKPE